MYDVRLAYSMLDGLTTDSRFLYIEERAFALSE